MRPACNVIRDKEGIRQEKEEQRRQPLPNKAQNIFPFHDCYVLT